MLWIVEAGDDVTCKLLGNKFSESHLSHPKLQNCSVLHVPLLSTRETSLLTELLQCLSECKNCVGWRSESELFGAEHVLLLIKQVQAKRSAVAFTLGQS